MRSKIILLTVLSLPLPLFATPCEQATRLVIQAYDLGNRPSVYAQKKKLLRHALSLCPNHADAHNNLGVVLEKEQHYPQALQHYQRALQIQPDYETWVGIGDVYYKQGQLPLSLEAYLHACTRNQHARQRVSYLLRENRYRAADAGNVLNKASLSLLYDKQRLQKLHQKATDCRSVFRLLVSTDSLLETFVIIRNIQFEVGEYVLTPDADHQLDEIANTLVDEINNGAKSIIISGHTDIQSFVGVSIEESNQRNWELSQKRATSVAKALSKRGISMTRMITTGYGHSQPVAYGNSEAAWAKNRRVEIEVE